MPDNKQNDNLNLRSEEVQEILSKPPIWIIRWGITLIFLFTCIMLTLTFIIRYPDFVAATVIITTEQPTERIVTRNSGALDQILIRNRDTVFPGERLAVVRNTAKTDHVDYLKSLLNTSAFKVENYYFPIDSTSNLILGDIETAYITFEKSYVNYQLLKNLDPYTGQLINNQESISELRKRLKNQVLQKKIQEQEFILKKASFERYQKLFQKGVISVHEFESEKIQYLQMQKDINSMAISISLMDEAIASANQSFRSTMVNKQEDYKLSATELSQSLNNLKKAIRDWEYNYVLSSSTLGVLSFQEFWGINQFINPGEIVFSILPLDHNNLRGKLVVPSQNAGKVIVGQRVLVKLNNFPYQQYGLLVGEIENISISPNKDGNYFVYISLSQGTKTSYNITLPLEQELIGIGEIITEDLSIAERIFYRLKNVFKSV